MYAKNYFETKSTITDGLNEFCESRHRPKNEKNKRISYSEILKLLITILPIVSAIFTQLFKFISMSSVWYYQFDFNYYDFSLIILDLFKFEIMFGLFVIISIFSYGITFMFLPNNDSIKKSFKLFVVISNCFYMFII